MPISVIFWLLLFALLIWRSFTKHPIWGLGAYLMALYAAPTHHWYGAYLPNLRWSLTASFVTLCSIWMNRHRFPAKTPWHSTGAGRILIAYTLWMWIQFPWAASIDLHISGCILFTKYVMLFYMIYTILDSDVRIYQFFMFNILGGIYWGDLIKATTRTGRVEHIGGPGVGDSNTLGMHLGIVLIFAALMLLKKNTIFRNRNWWRASQVVVFIGAVLMANGVVQSISRSAMVGLVAAGLGIFFLHYKAIRKKLLLYCLVALAGFIHFAPQTFWNRMDTVRATVEGEEVESSAYSRVLIAQAQLRMFQDNALGHGFQGTMALSPYYMPRELLTMTGSGEAGRSSHNTFLTALVEQGIPGAILYWFAVIWAVKLILSFRKDDVVVYLYVMMVAGGLAMLFISGQFVDYLKAEMMIYCFALLAGLKELARMRKKEEMLCAE